MKRCSCRTARGPRAVPRPCAIMISWFSSVPGDKAVVCRQGGLYWRLLSHKVVESHGLKSVTLYVEQ